MTICLCVHVTMCLCVHKFIAQLFHAVKRKVGVLINPIPYGISIPAMLRGLKSHLGVIDSNFLLHTLEPMSKIKKKIPKIFKNGRKIEFLKKIMKNSFSAKCAPFGHISIF